MLKKILDTIFLRKKTINTILVGIFLVGILSYTSFPRHEWPNVDLKSVSVIIYYDGASSTDVERLITTPIEKEMMTMKDSKEVISITKDGLVSFLVAFELNTEIPNIAKEVRNKILNIEELPQGYDLREVVEHKSSNYQFVLVGIHGDMGYRELVKVAEKYEDEFEKLYDVTDIEFKGKKEEIIDININTSAMEKYGLGINDVLNSFRKYNNLISAGKITNNNSDYSVKIKSLYKSATELRRLPIKSSTNKTIYLSDIANVKQTFDKNKDYVNINGNPGILLQINKKENSSTITLYESIKKKLAELDGTISPIASAVLIADESKDINDRISASENTVITAVIIVMTIIVAILGWRVGLLVGISIPTTYLLSITILNFMGMSYNLMSIMGLVLSVGLLVDGPIVITEYARREQEKGIRRSVSYLNAAHDMFYPIFASTLTTVLAFLPLAFWPDFFGVWIRVIPRTVLVVLLCSFFVTMIIIPVLGSSFGMKTAGMATKKDPYDSLLYTYYGMVVNYIIFNPIKVSLFGILIFFAIVYGTIKSNTEYVFFAEDKANSLEIEILAKGNLSPAESKGYLEETIDVIVGHPHIKNFYGNTIYRDRIWLFDNNPTDMVADIWVDLIDFKDRPDTDLVIKDLEERLSVIQGLNISVSANDYSGSQWAKDLTIEVQSSDSKKIRQFAEIVLQKLLKDDSYTDQNIKNPITGIEWIYNIDSNETKKYDLSKNTIGDSIKIATSGLTIGNIIPDNAEERIPVKIYLPSDEKTFSSIERTNISTSQGLVPLSNFVDKQKREKIFTIGKQQGMRTLVIDANIKEELNASAVKQDLANWVNELNLPSNVFIKFAGEAEDSASSMSFLIIAFLGALVAIFIVLITLFNSFYHTFIILFSVILSIGGILLGTLLLGLKFSIVFSGLGIVACMGIVVNNNIILIDSYRKELSKNDNNIYDAILIACKNRIRPIFLTTITTITGLLPSALQISLDIFDRTIAYKSEETYFFVLLAWSLIWGIGFASFATLFVTPALLALPKSLSNIFYSKSKILNDKVLID